MSSLFSTHPIAAVPLYARLTNTEITKKLQYHICQLSKVNGNYKPSAGFVILGIFSSDLTQSCFEQAKKWQTKVCSERADVS